jgi:DNA-binding transcriptional MerR regulator
MEAKTYTIGEVEEITGIKAHVLRYWEEQLPSLAPQKALSGRRTYSDADLRLFKRLNHLITENRYTIPGARQRIIEEEAAARRSDLFREVRDIREELARVAASLRVCGANS